MKAEVPRLLLDEEGQGMTEYALILGFVVFAVWAILTVSDIGGAITSLFRNVKSEITKCQAEDAGCRGDTTTP